MTAAKKSPSKITKSPVPATKSAVTRKASAPDIAPRKTSAAKAAPGTLGKKKGDAKGPGSATEPVIKQVPAPSVVTTINARIDIGFGNALYIRGEGPGLNWDEGVVMECVTDDHWKLELTESARPVFFKLLINDLNWSTGTDFTVAPGDAVTVKPVF